MVSRVHQARTLLLRIKQGAKPRFLFVADDQDISRLPAWVKTARQTTDGHLVAACRQPRSRSCHVGRQDSRSIFHPCEIAALAVIRLAITALAIIP